MLPLYDDQRTRSFPIATLLLILINAYVFIVWQHDAGLDRSIKLAGFVPHDFADGVQGALTRLCTSMFMHASWMHLLGNMWFLWVFGKGVEDSCGPVRFVAFYVLAGAAATAAYGWFSAGSTIPLVGASGAISGVLGAYLLRNPKAKILTLVPLVIIYRILALPAWFFLLVWIGLQVFAQVGDAQHGSAEGGVAYVAHISGFIAGMGLIYFFERPREY